MLPNVRSRYSRLLVLTASMLVVVAAPSAAQRAERKLFSVGGSGGFSRGSGGSVGYQMVATLEVRTPLPFLQARLDGMLADWGGDIGFTGPLVAYSANAILAPLPNASVSPYLLAGSGVYGRWDSKVREGYTLGVGLRLPGMRTVFVESRMHQFRTGSVNPAFAMYADKWTTVWAPIGVGVQF